MDANNATENSGSSKGMKEDYVLGERKGATGNQKPQNKKETSTETLKENGKASRSSTTTTPLKTDYIHVRARRGQATDSHSLAERVCDLSSSLSRFLLKFKLLHKCMLS